MIAKDMADEFERTKRPGGPIPLKSRLGWLFATVIGMLAVFGYLYDGFGALRSSDYPVRWTELVDLKWWQSIDKRLAAPLKLSGEKDDHLELSQWSKGQKVETVVVRTGREYIDRLKESFEPHTHYDRAMERLAHGEVMALAILQKARPSRVSFVKDLSFETIQLEDIPYSIMVFTESKPEDFTFHDDCPDAIIESRTPHRLLWYCLLDPDDKESKLGYLLELLAWGDFNDDGIEDVLCNFMYDFVYGYNRDAYMVVLSKYSAEGKLQLVNYGGQILRK